MSIIERLKTIDQSLLKKGVELKDFNHLSPPLVLNYDDTLSVNSSLTGGKGSSLGILNMVKGTLVPYFFTVTTFAFKTAIKSSNFEIPKEIQTLQELSNKIGNNQKNGNPRDQNLEKKLYLQAQKIRRLIRKCTLSDKLKKEVEKNYKFFADKLKMENFSVAVRSSSTTEDMENASSAGLHNTYLNQRGIADICRSIKKCWASVFSNCAVQYRNLQHINHSEAQVAVVIQKMCFPSASGTSFTIEIGTTFPGIHVCSVRGLGEGLVSGSLTSDEYLLNEDNFNLIKRTKGSNKIQYEILESSSGIHVTKTESSDKERKNKEDYVLSLEMIKKIAKTTKRIGKVYKELFDYDYIDTEYCCSKTPTLYMLQCRPVVPVVYGENEILTVEESVVQANKGSIILKGKYSLLGASHGKIKVIERFEDLVEGKKVIEKDDIVVSTKTGNYWNQFLVEFKGLITSEGSPTAHPMLIGRERKKVCVIGCPNSVELMKPFEGRWVTLDGINKRVILGKIPLVEANQKLLQQQFQIMTKEQFQKSEDSLKFLKDFGRIKKDHSTKNNDENNWIANPNYELSQLLREIVVKSYGRRVELFRKIVGKDAKDPFGKDYKIIDNFVCEKYKPLSAYALSFKGFSIDQATKYHQLYQSSMEEFDVSTLLFANTSKDDPKKLVEIWRKVVFAFENLYAMMLTSFFFRSYINYFVSHLGNELKISSFHYLKFSRVYQSTLFEEDVAFRDNIVELATELISQMDKVDDIDKLTFKELQKIDQKLAEKIEMVAKNYRINKIANFKVQIDVAIEKVFQKIKETLKANGATKLKELKNYQNKRMEKKRNNNQKGEDIRESKEEKDSVIEETEYFPENQEFKKWTQLGVDARVAHCNAHHIKFRGQIRIKEKLLKLFGNDSILDKSIESIEKSF